MNWVRVMAVCTVLIVMPLTVLAQRVETPLDDGWRFVRQDVPAAKDTEFDDTGWQAVTLPHTFNAGDAGSGGDKARGETEGSYYRGPGWYRRMLDLTPEAGRRYVLNFDGAALVTELWVNGQSIGRHDGGYAAFRFDITPALKPGKNLIAVRVDNRRFPHIAPLTGDFIVFGGLYRKVSLISVPEAHISLGDHGGPGIYVTTKAIAPKAMIGVKTLLTNDRAAPVKATVSTRILDATGKVVAMGTTRHDLMAGQTLPVETALRIARARLWAGRADPYLYRVEVSVTANGRRDTVAAPLGIRTVAVDKTGTFRLNGKPYRIYGTNMQQPGRYGKGTAVSDAEIAEDMQIMDEMGVTALRLAHMQHPKKVYEEADRRGILITTEVPLVDEIDNSDAFRDTTVAQMRELVAQNYNHPSVATWGLGNELRVSSPQSNAVLAGLQATAKGMDPYRPTNYAHCCLDDNDAIANHSDTISYNRYFGWYWGEHADMGKWADDLHAKYPDRILGVSEYGAGASIKHQEDPPKRTVPQSYWHPEQYQALYHEANWRELNKRPYLWSNFIWLAFDFPSFRRNEGDRPAINDKGLVTEDRKVRKDAWYWYQANWSEAPMVHITSRRDTPKRAKFVTVKIYTNQPEVSLTFNGQRLSPKKPDDHIATWDIELIEGDNTVTATAGAVTDSVVWQWTARTGGL
ncbi:glycoside hydrolase family 2 TIM barrel-domain containing protein [Asticcacaulis sp. BYS171W]|uniref:Glycoside hydrolase family 2 TIM barrel-domain containing protein n=1 Tax=Asticcacaulis aquaticus TaxID=2984212 RepID=A0ABT5HVS4_9CAUL|nr:glycoside hydrolase family 2 TIM barrel-domain containing protein [Asticcacaulis aquaticus]MDC7684149.1 glycoside hydrolase family 2 TIM barrel-domain containing protein [Asticcacaulis aquaticus]